MSESKQKVSAAAAGEVVIIICLACGESWDQDTPGYEEAKIMLDQSFGSYCPSCQFKSFNDLGLPECPHSWE